MPRIMEPFTSADRERWFARYGDDYTTPAEAEADYAEYLAERDVARSIMGPADEEPECDRKPAGDLRHVLSPEHGEQLSGDDMTTTLDKTEPTQSTCPEWCTDHRSPGLDLDGRNDETEFHRQIMGNVPGIGEVSIEQDYVEQEPFVFYGQDLGGAASVRAFAEALAKAADLMDSINAKDAA